MKYITVLADASGRQGQGWLRFDDVELIRYEPAPVIFDTLPQHLVTSSTPYASLSDILAVSIHFLKDDRALDIIRAAGFRWIRMDLKWEMAEATRGSYNFAFFRELIDAAKARGLNTLAILAYGNPLYTGERMTPPTTDAAIQAYARFATEAVKAFAGTPTRYELWNEPDLGTFWGGAPDESQFARLMARTAAAFRAANLNPQFVTGGLSAPGATARAFEKKLEESGTLAHGHMGIHLYTRSQPESRLDEIYELAGNVARYRSSAQLWCTEWGYASSLLDPQSNGHAQTGRHLQALYTVRMILVSWLARLPLLTIYDIRDDGTNPSDKEHNYGLIDRNYNDKPAMTAVRTLTSLAATRRLIGAINPSAFLPPGMHSAKLEGASDAVWILWLDDRSNGRTEEIVLPANYQALVDVFGRPITPVTRSGKKILSLSATSGPVYITVSKTAQAQAAK